ncbi:hypothetical protein D9M73_117280 [compost metagenome]
MPRISKPAACSAAARRMVGASSPITSGRICDPVGVTPQGPSVRSAKAMSAVSRSRRSGSSARRRRLSRTALAISGEGAVEKMKARPRLTRKSRIVRGPQSKAPSQPKALPHVRKVMTFSAPSRSAANPRPPGPNTPVACASSISSIASCRAATVARSASGARSPSMLYRLSTAIHARPVPPRRRQSAIA